MAKVKGYKTRVGVSVPSYSRRKRKKLGVKPIVRSILKRRSVQRDGYGRFYD